MMDFYKGTIPILDDAEPEGRDMLYMPQDQFARGYVPRDYKVDPEAMFASPNEMDLIPESDWDARYDEQEELKSSLEHIYLSGPGGAPAFVNLDQNGHGDCWIFSTGQTTMIDRLARNMPLVTLNPHAGAVILNQLSGGWCGMSAKFAREVGFAEDGNGPGQWPGHSRSKQYDTPALRAKMAKYKTLEDWVDLTRQVYDQNLTTRHVATCGFTNIPTAQDFNHWSHSVSGLRWVRISRGNWGPLILNSWKLWGRFGLAVLQGSKATCNGGVAIRATTASIVA